MGIIGSPTGQGCVEVFLFVIPQRSGGICFYSCTCRHRRVPPYIDSDVWASSEAQPGKDASKSFCLSFRSVAEESASILVPAVIAGCPHTSILMYGHHRKPNRARMRRSLFVCHSAA